MATAFPLTTLAPSITAQGVQTITYADILTSLKASFKQIYGNDVYLEPDSQDGQLLSIFALAIYDCGQATLAAYNAFSPATAFGEGLSRVVKINHMQRQQASNSSAVVSITGQAGVVVNNGVVGDAGGNRWLLPSVVLIPPAGLVSVSAVAEVSGALEAAAGTLTTILTPTTGWQSVTNPASATVGVAVETDADLRARQEISTALHGITVLDSILGTVQNLSGVTKAQAYENDTGVIDALGLPPHSVALVVRGGDSNEVATAIFQKKTPGVATYGTTTITVDDPSGTPRDINYFVPTTVSIIVEVTLRTKPLFTTVTSDTIKQSVADYINQLDIGDTLEIGRLYSPALLGGAASMELYTLVSVRAAREGFDFSTNDVPILFTEEVTCTSAAVTIILV